MRPEGKYCKMCEMVFKLPGAKNCLSKLGYPLCTHKDEPCEIRD